MEHDDSDEHDFWRPEPTRRLRLHRASGPPRETTVEKGVGCTRVDPSAAVSRTDEPTRQLRVTPGRRAGAPASVGRRAAPSPDPQRVDPLDRRGAHDDKAEYYRELGDLLERDVAAAMGESVPLVTVATRRSWLSRVRREDGRLDPVVTRLGVLLLVGAVALPLVTAMSAGGGRTDGAAVVARRAVSDDVASTDPAAVTAVVAVNAATPVAVDAPTPQATATGNITSATPTAHRSVVTPTIAAVVTTRVGDAASAAGDVTVATGPSSAAAGPAIESLRSCSVSYPVAAGDYWLGIARRAGVTVGALLAANNATAATPLYPGRTICLPRGVATPLRPASTTATPTAVTATTAQPTTAAPPKRTSAVTVPSTTPPTPTTVAPTTTGRTKAIATPTKPTTATVAKSTTTTAVPTTTTMPAKVYTRDQVAQIIRDVWPDDLEDKAVAIATRESNLKPGVRNFCCFGLFQIYFSVHQSWLAAMGITNANQLFDPTANAQAALALYSRDGGWGPWGG